MTRAVVLSEHETYDPEKCAALQGGTLDGSNRSILRELSKGPKLEVSEGKTGLRIKTFSHVGRVALGNLSITIQPKLAEEVFLQLLGYVYKLDALDFQGQAGFDASGAALQELFIAVLNTRVRELIRRGLARRYRSRTEALASPRGKLDLRRWATSVEPLLGRAPCIHHVRSSDHLLNSVLLAGTELAMHMTESTARKAELRDSSRRLAEEASAVPLNAALFRAARAQLNRLVIGYEQPLALIETLYAGHGASWLPDTHVELSGFLFDMDRFFQELLEKFLSEHLAQEYSVTGEKHLRGLFRYSRNPKNKPHPVLKPDFTVRGGGHTRLLDAKYRDLWAKALPREMLYQLSVYALSQGRGATVAILYPTESPAAREAVLDICDPLGGSVLGHVAVRPVHMSRLVKAITAPERSVANSLARELAFGADA